jgi:hypothetical protein
MDTPPRVFVPGEDEYKAGRENGYDFGFLHIKVKCIFRLFLLILTDSDSSYNVTAGH